MSPHLSLHVSLTLFLLTQIASELVLEMMDTPKAPGGPLRHHIDVFAEVDS